MSKTKAKAGPTDWLADPVNAYAALGRFSTAAIGGAMGVAIRGAIVRQYVRTYVRTHGRYPTGPHRVKGVWQGQPIRFDAQFPGEAAAAMVAHGVSLARDDLLGSTAFAREGAFARARREWRQSPDRARLRAWLRKQVEDALHAQGPDGEG